MFARIGGMSENDAYREGYDAALEGNRRCPHTKMSTPYKIWWKGFLDAQERKRALLSGHSELDKQMDQRIAAENT